MDPDDPKNRGDWQTSANRWISLGRNNNWTKDLCQIQSDLFQEPLNLLSPSKSKDGGDKVSVNKFGSYFFDSNYDVCSNKSGNSGKV